MQKCQLIIRATETVIMKGFICTEPPTTMGRKQYEQFTVTNMMTQEMEANTQRKE